MKTCFCLVACSVWLLGTVTASADGLILPPRDYKGSLEERAQEAIIVFRQGDESKSAEQDLILKIRAAGDVDSFAWVIPFPNPPKAAKEDNKLFKEIFDYVQARKRPKPKKKTLSFGAKNEASGSIDAKVDVISRDIVGSYDVAVVRENKADGLNDWLETEGFRTVPGGDRVLSEYRDKGYVFACMKVSDTELSRKREVELHPLRFTFKTGGRDGIYFPMRITGLQTQPFDINLYVFYRAWLNDKINEYGYTRRGFRLNFRDWDTSKCKPNAGKIWSDPAKDPYLKNLAYKVPAVTSYFKKHHDGERFYLTNIQARQLKPETVRDWKDELWLFPYYTKRTFVPYDARAGGPARFGY